MEVVYGLGGAILGSLLAGCFDWWFHGRDEIRAKLEQLRLNLVKLLDLRDELETRIPTMEPALQADAGRRVNSKRMIHLGAAENLIQELHKYLTATDYLTLAYEFQISEWSAEAERCYLAAVHAPARSLDVQAWARRALAQFYFSLKKDLPKGRRLFQEACASLQHSSDSYSGYLLGLAYQTWATLERDHGDRSREETLLAEARKAWLAWKDDARCRNSLAALPRNEKAPLAA
jgi:hypothetical protein